MRKIVMTAATLAATTPLAFASAPAPTKGTTATATAPAANKTGPKKDRVAPVVSAVTTDVPMPEFSTNRGSKSLYPFDDLAVGGSFGVANKTLKQMSSIISNQNRKTPGQKRDDNGALMFEQVPVKDANNNVIGHQPGEPIMLPPVKEFRGADVDAKKDPQKATVRIWRVR